jgi:hypothetical protein
MGVVIAGILALVSSDYWAPRVDNWWNERQVGLTIADPKETSSGRPANVPRVYTVAGHIDHVPNNRELWVIVQVAEKANGYYPQGPAELNDDGTWSCVVGFGSRSPNEADNRYRIYAALADPAEEAELRDWIFDELPTATTGMEHYPGDGLDHVSSVDVVRSASDHPGIEAAVNQPGCSA